MRTSIALVMLSIAGLAACGDSEKKTDSGTVPAAAATDTAASEPAPAKAAEGTTPGERVPNFTVKGTTDGKETTVPSSSPDAVTVYCVTSSACPTTRAYADKLRDIETSYTPKGVRFVWLYPNRSESDADKAACHAERKLGGVFSVDHGAAAAKTLATDHTPEMVVVGKDGRIAYRGAIDDGEGDPKRAKQEGLKDALDATLAGKAVQVTSIPPAG
jgi:hypothetical protein